MPSMILPPVTTSAPNQAAGSSGPRGRAADPSDGSSFGAALNRSRAGADKQPADDADVNATVVDKLAGLKGLPGEGKDKKDELPSDLLNMAFLVTAQLPTDPAVAAAAVAKTAADADASVAATAAAATAKGKMAAGLPQDTQDATLPDADAAADAAKTPLSAEEVVKAAKALASKDAAPAEDGDVQTTPADGKSRAEAATPAASLAALLPATPAASGASAKTLAVPKTSTVKPAGADTAASATADMQKAAKAPEVQVAAVTAPMTDPKSAQAPGAASGDSNDLAPTTNPLSASAMPQAAAADRAAPADRAPVLSVAPPVGSDDWGPAIGQQMIRMSASGHQTAELNLNPANLGPLKVTLSLGDNQAQAMFVSAHESVRKAVEAALPQLRSTLAEQGISLGHTSVGAETRQPGQGGNEFAQQQSPSRQQGAPSYPGASRIDTAAAALPAERTAVLRHAGSGVDTFA